MNMYCRWLCIVQVALFVNADTVFADGNSTVIPMSRDTSGKSWLSQRYAVIENDLGGNIDLSRVNVLFVGDSITQFWLNHSGNLWAGTFTEIDSPFYALNLGVAGDRTEHVLYRLKAKMDGGMGELDDPRLNPKVIVLMIGTNNLRNNKPEEIVDGVTAVKNRLRQLRPDARLILSSILPSAKDELNETVGIPVNNAIKTLQTDPAVIWLDLYTKYVDADGMQSSELFRDGVHPNEDGYQIWYASLMPVLRQLME